MHGRRLRHVTRTGVLGSLAFVLMFFEFPIPFLFPDFLKMDASDIPALLGAFAMGPMTGMAVELVKNLLHFAIRSSTGGIGELANFLTGATFAATAGIVYAREKNRRQAITALTAGTLSMAAVMCALNYFLLIPFFFGTPPSVELLPLIYGAILPFNILKGILLSLLTIPIYEKVSLLLHR